MATKKIRKRMPMEMEMVRKLEHDQPPKAILLGAGTGTPPAKKTNYKTKPETNSDEIQISTIQPTIKNQDIVEETETKTSDFGILPAFRHDPDRRYNKEDLKYNFFVIYFTSWIKICALGVDKSSKNYPVGRAGHGVLWKNIICFCWSFFALIRCLTMIFSTIHFVVTGDAEKELNRMTFVICVSVMVTLLEHSTLVALGKIQDCVVIVNSICKYLDDEPEPKELSRNRNRSWRKFGFGFHTPKELLIIYLPFLVFSLCGLIPLISIFDPTLPILLVSLAPSATETTAVSVPISIPGLSFQFQFQFHLRFPVTLEFFTLMLLDSVIFSYFVMMVFMVFYLFFGMHRIEEEARLTLKHMNMESKLNKNSKVEELKKNQKVLNALKSIRLLHIWTQLFNFTFGNIVYSCKLIALTAAIFGGFGFIKMLERENWPYAIVFGLFFLEGIILYDVAFGAAFKIPERVEEVKTQCRQLSHMTKIKIKMEVQNAKLNQNGNKNANQNPTTRSFDEEKYVEKFLRSVPWLGVKDGVYKMEKMTCANFLDFAMQQIIDLVMAY